MNSEPKCSGAVNIVMSEPKTESRQLGSKRGSQNPRPRESGIEAVRLKKRVPKPEDPHGNLILDIRIYIYTYIYRYIYLAIVPSWVE